MSYNPSNLFAQIKEREEKRQAEATSQFESNEFVYKLKVGNSYVFRLLWFPPVHCDREYPMINQYTHNFMEKGKKPETVYCPTSQYIKGETREGFECPCCKSASALYKEGETSPSAKALYTKFRRTCVGYVPVMVLAGPSEDVGKVKILRYGKQFKDKFDSYIFGIEPKKSKNNKEEDTSSLIDQPLGIEAFAYLDEKNKLVTEGYNLIVKVTTKKVDQDGQKIDMNNYDISFSRSKVDISEKINAKQFTKLNQMMKFDEDFYKTSTNEELVSFNNKFIIGDGTQDEQEESEIQSDFDKISKSQKKTTKPSTTRKPTPPPVEEEEEVIVEDQVPMDFKQEEVESEDDDMESFIDDLLKK